VTEFEWSLIAALCKTELGTEISNGGATKSHWFSFVNVPTSTDSSSRVSCEGNERPF
jgi:hypothetical protein